MAKPWLLFAPLALAAALSAGDASAEASITLGEVAVPPSSSGVDHASLKTAAEGELRGVDPSRLRKHRHRKVLVAVAVTNSSQSPFGCTVNALLRDAKTGVMLAIVEGRAQSDGEAKGEANAEQRRRILRAAVHIAVGQIPDALSAN